MTLNKTQKQVAIKLLEDRPTVLPGTRAILDDAARKTWFDAVCDAMTQHSVKTPEQIATFCDLAGVPD